MQKHTKPYKKAHSKTSVFITFIFKMIYDAVTKRVYPFGPIQGRDNVNHYIDRQFIYSCYQWFFGYLNLLKKYVYYVLGANVKNISWKHQLNICVKGIEDTNFVHIKIDDYEKFWHFNNTYHNDEDEDENLYRDENGNYAFFFIYGFGNSNFNGVMKGGVYLTDNGLNIYSQYEDLIYPYQKPTEHKTNIYILSSIPCPSKCVKIEITTTTST
jgi:hypothetical protein